MRQHLKRKPARQQATGTKRIKAIKRPVRPGVNKVPEPLKQ